jgi:hypothetical protein
MTDNKKRKVDEDGQNSEKAYCGCDVCDKLPPLPVVDLLDGATPAQRDANAAEKALELKRQKYEEEDKAALQYLIDGVTKKVQSEKSLAIDDGQRKIDLTYCYQLYGDKYCVWRNATTLDMQRINIVHYFQCLYRSQGYKDVKVELEDIRPCVTISFGW